MYCTSCGKQIDDNAMFCPYCGVKVLASKSDFETGLSNSDMTADPGMRAFPMEVPAAKADPGTVTGGIPAEAARVTAVQATAADPAETATAVRATAADPAETATAVQATAAGPAAQATVVQAMTAAQATAVRVMTAARVIAMARATAVQAIAAARVMVVQATTARAITAGAALPEMVRVTVQALAGPVAPALEADRMDRTGAVTGHLKKERIPRSFGDRERQRG